MSHLQLLLFGPPRLEKAGEPLAVDTHKGLALLIYLALEEGPQSRDALAALFWPDVDDTHARAALRPALYTVRKVLGEEALSADRYAITFNRSGSLSVDALLLETALAGMEAADSEQVAALAALLETVKGEFRWSIWK